jgi:hypothetical protein
MLKIINNSSGWLKELMIFSFLLLIFAIYILLFGQNGAVNLNLILYLSVLVFVNTLLSSLRTRFQFPNIDFERELLVNNRASAIVVSSIYISTAIIIGCGIIALAWITN